MPLLVAFGLVSEPMGWGANRAELDPHLPEGARVVEWPDAGHFVHMEQPGIVADTVLEFLA